MIWGDLCISGVSPDFLPVTAANGQIEQVPELAIMTV